MLSAIGLAPILGLAAITEEEPPTVVASQWKINPNEFVHVAYSDGEMWVTQSQWIHADAKNSGVDNLTYYLFNSSDGKFFWLTPGTHEFSGKGQSITLGNSTNGNP